MKDRERREDRCRDGHYLLAFGFKVGGGLNLGGFQRQNKDLGPVIDLSKHHKL